MGTVPLSVIHGFDYPICNNSSGTHTIFVLYFLVVLILVLDCNAAASVTQRGERNYFWPSSLATKVKTKVISNTKQSNY